MKIDYYMDLLKPHSKSYTITPPSPAKKLPFYITAVGRFIAGSKYYTERSGLDKYLLFYTLSGSGFLKYKNSYITMKAGQAAIIDCNEYQYYKTLSEDKPWEFRWIHFNGIACQEYCRLINEETLANIPVYEKVFFETLLEKVESLALDGNVLSHVRISNHMTSIMTILFENKPKFNYPSTNPVKINIEVVTNFIHNNYQDKISLDMLASLIPISKFYLLRLFKAYTGISPYEYLTNYRINKAKGLLKETSLPVNEIANKVGFPNTNNFIREFSKLVGTTPLKFRKYWVV